MPIINPYSLNKAIADIRRRRQLDEHGYRCNRCLLMTGIVCNACNGLDICAIPWKDIQIGT